jgi:hypothetical protein
MKFFGSALILTIINFCLINARPNDYRQQDDKFYFWLDNEHKATIKGLSDRSIKDVVIPQYFVVDGERWYVNSIGHAAFSGYDITSVTIPDTIESITFDTYAFEDCKKLKTLTINAGKVPKVALRAFYKTNVDIVIKGSAVPAFTEALAKSVLSDFGLSVNKDYTNVSQYNRKKDLFTLGKKLNRYITFDGNADQGNAAVALAVGHASWGGVSRAYYQLARAMGIKATEVLIGGDAAVSAWNYVKVDGKWYNVDVSRYEFKNDSYNNAFFKSKSQFSTFLNEKQPSGKYNNKPSYWVVVRDLIHYQGESYYHGTTYFDSYLSQNNLGSRA